ncbi:MAG: hypothetical protein VCB42_03720, partial [Myxococcota bacterium]
AGKSTEAAFRTLDEAGVPCEISSQRASIDLWADDEAIQNQWIVKYPHEMVEEIGQVGLAFGFSDTPARIQGAPMLVGEHTRSLLAELGYDDAEIEGLFEAGAVGDTSLHPALAGDDTATVKSPWDPSE